jgi:hypothetical protein
MPHEHSPLYSERRNLAGIFLFWDKVISFRVFSRATISALFEGIPLRGLDVTSVLVFLFYFSFLTSDIRSHVRALSLLGIEVWEFMGVFLGYESRRLPIT